MAKNKHEQLADLMKLIQENINHHTNKVKKNLNFILFHFHEKYFIFNRPLISLRSLNSMMKCYYVGLQRLSPIHEIKMTCLTKPWMGILFEKPIFAFNEFLKLSKDSPKYIIPWQVMTTLPFKDESKLEQSKLRALLYCPDISEISKEISWTEKEDAADSLTYQLLSILASYEENERLKSNLLQDPIPIYDDAIKEWIKHSTCDLVAKNPKNLERADFAPKAGMSIAVAYELIMKSIIERSSHHRHDLRSRYKRKLEKHIFLNTALKEEEKQAFLKQWKTDFVQIHPNQKTYKSNCLEQCKGIDFCTASRFICYFTSKFINDPTDYKSGEIACILWIFIWCAQEGNPHLLSVDEVLTLSSTQITPEKSFIQFKNYEMKISKGLQQLLLCLRGEGKGIRSRPLFANVNKKDLERALHKASEEILGKGVTPVLPTAFLVPLNLHLQTRVSLAERLHMKNTRQRVPYRYTSQEILESFKNKKH